jgi:hypothetical protein
MGLADDGCCLTYLKWSYQLPKERAMEKHRPDSRMFEPATFRIGILGTLDKQWSDYCGGMTIEHLSVLDQFPMTILTGQLTDQSALIGVINSLFDMGCPILLVECVEASELRIFPDSEGDDIA